MTKNQLSDFLDYARSITYTKNEINYQIFSKKSGYKNINLKNLSSELNKGMSLFIPAFESSNSWNKGVEILIFSEEKGYIIDVSIAEAVFEIDGGSLELQKEYFDIYLSILKTIYNIFHPELGMAVSDDPEYLLTFDLVERLKINHLAPIMFFGPKYVKKYGKIPLLKIYGAWKIEAFKDGGIMIVLNPLYFVEGRREKFLKACGKLLAIFDIQPDEQMRWYDW